MTSSEFFRPFLISFFLIFPLFGDWADDKLNEMSLDEKLGQLFVVPVCPLRNDHHLNQVKKILETYHIGSLIVKKSDPKAQVETLALLQNFSKEPLLVMADAEWGLGMRMEETISYPKNMTLGAIFDNDIIFQIGKRIADELFHVGVHVNLSPVVDVNTNPQNPVIGMRAFSDNVLQVSQKGKMMILGLQNSQRILACAKHFPGHGDTAIDSHLALPLIMRDKKSFTNCEFLPFQKAIDANVSCIMMAHIMAPLISGLPATMSKEFIDILRNELHFKGAIITDALNMRALTSSYSTEEIVLNSHLAGCDFLLYGDHIIENVDEILSSIVPKAYQTLKEYYLQNKERADILDEKVLKVLRIKEKLGLNRNRKIEYDPKKINKADSRYFKKFVYESCLTLLCSNGLHIDFDKKVAVASNMQESEAIFPNLLHYRIEDPIDEHDTLLLFIDESDLDKIEKFDKKKTVVVWMGSPYLISQLKGFKNVVLAYERDSCALQAFEKIVSSKGIFKGKLPIILEKDSSV